MKQGKKFEEETTDIIKYRNDLEDIINSINDVHILKYFMRLIPKLVKEWQ